MPIGLTNTTINMTTIQQLSNVTDPVDVMININHTIFNGYFFFLMLMTLWIIMLIVSYKSNSGATFVRDFINTGTFITVLSFILRTIYIVKGGIEYAMMTDTLMWIFPLLTLIMLVIAKINSQSWKSVNTLTQLYILFLL